MLLFLSYCFNHVQQYLTTSSLLRILVSFLISYLNNYLAWPKKQKQTNKKNDKVDDDISHSFFHLLCSSLWAVSSYYFKSRDIWSALEEPSSNRQVCWIWFVLTHCLIEPFHEHGLQILSLWMCFTHTHRSILSLCAIMLLMLIRIFVFKTLILFLHFVKYESCVYLFVSWSSILSCPHSLCGDFKKWENHTNCHSELTCHYTSSK